MARLPRVGRFFTTVIGAKEFKRTPKENATVWARSAGTACPSGRPHPAPNFKSPDRKFEARHSMGTLFKHLMVDLSLSHFLQNTRIFPSLSPLFDRRSLKIEWGVSLPRFQPSISGDRAHCSNAILPFISQPHYQNILLRFILLSDSVISPDFRGESDKRPFVRFQRVRKVALLVYANRIGCAWSGKSTVRMPRRCGWSRH
jgi:hypothetical protein